MTSSKSSSGGTDSSSSKTGRDPGGISIVTSPVKNWVVGMITAFAIGAIAGAALACHYVESQFREFFFSLALNSS
jgi:hypothetical protein